uniref:Uncharacterized protein n=1 Tax=Arundo donax TaxID=35708 RepID=A0A0A8ZGJ7_ARUDO
MLLFNHLVLIIYHRSTVLITWMFLLFGWCFISVSYIFCLRTLHRKDHWVLSYGQGLEKRNKAFASARRIAKRKDPASLRGISAR